MTSVTLTECESGDVLLSTEEGHILTDSLTHSKIVQDRQSKPVKKPQKMFYMSDVGSSLPNMSGMSRSSGSAGSSHGYSPDMSPKIRERVFKFDLIGPGSKSIGYTVCTSSSTSKLLQRPKPKPVANLSGNSSPTSPHKFLRESRSLDREDETDRFPEPRQLQKQETLDSSASSVQALQEKMNNNNLISRPPLRTAKSFDFGYKRPTSAGESQNSQQPSSGSDTLTVNTNINKMTPSPATKRRINYFQKLASSVLSSTRSSSSGPPSPQDRKSTSGSGESLSGTNPSSPDFTSSDESGFDTFSPPSSPAVMHKGRQSTSPSSKFIPKKIWRTKSKPQTMPATTNLWNPEGNCRWHSVSGRTVTLTTTTLMQLSELERRQLQKVAHQRLQSMHLGPIIVPKDPLIKRPKKGSFLRGRHRNNSVLDSMKDIESGAPLVFGIPLEKCISNEHALKRYHSIRRKERRESLDLAQSPPLVKPTATGKQLKSSTEDIPSTTTPSSSSSGSVSSTSTSLLDALSLSTSTHVEVQQACRERRNSLLPQVPKIPQVLKNCFGYMSQYGLHTLGIFRVGGSKKRTRQLREDYDSGLEIFLTESHNPHDVGALVKEFFRDLPEPLLTRELYPAFVACNRIENVEQQLRALQLLIYLLPKASRDTLKALLDFLLLVSLNAADTVDSEGNEISGNKMNTHNLATLFGPNILRKTKGSQDHVGHGLQEASEQVEESREVISVVQCMAKHKDVVFQVPGEIQDSVLRITYDMDPEALDYLLTKRATALGCIDSSEMESSFDDSSSPCTPEEILMPFHAIRGHEHRVLSSPDDMYNHRNKADFSDEMGRVAREQMLSKQKSLSLPRAAPVIDSRFPSSPKIARTSGLDDRQMRPLSVQPTMQQQQEQQQGHTGKNKRGLHSNENLDNNSDPSLTSISPPTRLLRGISNEKQIFSPLSPHSPRRISGPVSPLVGQPPENQFSAPGIPESGTVSSPNPELSFQSKSPRTVRKHTSDLLPSPWKLNDELSEHIWQPVDGRRTQSVSDGVKLMRPNVISPCLPRRNSPLVTRMVKVPIAAMEEDFDMDVPIGKASRLSPTPGREEDKQQGKWKQNDDHETLV